MKQYTLKQKLRTSIQLTSLIIMGVLAPVHGITQMPSIDAIQDPVKKGLAIAIAADQSDEGWGDWSADAEMILRNRHGQTSSRQMHLKSLEQADDGDKRLISFASPRDVKGTSLLVFTHRVGDDDRWLYLPALKRVKRISSSNQSGPFVGSEFAYEDLASQEVDKYTYKYIKDAEHNGMDAYVMERYPVDKNSGYTKQIVWIDKAEYRAIKIDYYDRKNELLKTFDTSGWNSYAKDYWRADQFEMINHQNGKSTQLKWSNYAFSVGLKDSNFNQQSLKRMR